MQNRLRLLVSPRFIASASEQPTTVAPQIIEYTSTLAGADWESLKSDLLGDDFHNGRTTAQLRMSFENSSHLAMAFDKTRCVGNGRLLLDLVGNALVVDVWTHSSYRKRGVATKIMQMLIASVPGQRVYLQSDDAIGFYTKLGFWKRPEGLVIVSGKYLESKTLDV